MTQNYDINSIESLTFKEGVRARINMYLGSDDLEGTYQALKEIINNSTDEALAGFCKNIQVFINPYSTDLDHFKHQTIAVETIDSVLIVDWLIPLQIKDNILHAENSWNQDRITGRSEP